jgi:GNAT superfamily N-acetyltransferase
LHDFSAYRPGEEAAQIAMLQAEFPGRWPRDLAVSLAAGAAVSDVMGAFRAGGTPVGFAQLTLPGSPGAQRWGGFKPAMAALGPIGVAADARGGGLGLAVLAAGLRHLRDREAGPTVIDWIDLLALYARVGFAPWLRYVQGRRSLP